MYMNLKSLKCKKKKGKTIKSSKKPLSKNKGKLFLVKGLQGSISQIFLHIITDLEIVNKNLYLHFKY